MDVVGLLRPEPAAAVDLILEPVVGLGDLVPLGDWAGALDDVDAGVDNFGGIPFIFFGVAFGAPLESLSPVLDEFRFALAAATGFLTDPKTFLAAADGAGALVPLTGAVAFKVSTMVYNF
jgi:hypothetical protein